MCSSDLRLHGGAALANPRTRHLLGEEAQAWARGGALDLVLAD